MEIPVKKNGEYIVDIIDNGFEGEGIAKIQDFTIFVKNALKGEKVKILVMKVNTSYAFAKILEYIEKSENRVEPDCLTYKRCGGCDLRHVNYKTTLNMKKNIVKSLVNKTLTKKVNVEDTIGMENPYNYRNKAQYPVSIDNNNNVTIGVFANRTHEVIPIKKCMIQKSISEEISKVICEHFQKYNIPVYNEKTRKGILRHIMIRIGIKTNEIMCVLIVNSNNIKKENELVDKLIKLFPNIKTIVKNINNKNTNVILGEKNINLYGDGTIYDILGNYTFKISVNSFYQINPVQKEKLYNIAIEKAELTGNEIVFDLYCGIGTIGIFASKKAKKVYGIEIVKQAIENAKENAKINKIDNIEFTAGDAKKILDDYINIKRVIPDVVFVDPPRKGLDNHSIENLKKVRPKKIVYISCNPATLIRDLHMFEDEYDIGDIQPVDMFPFTHHVECVVLMSRVELN